MSRLNENECLHTIGMIQAGVLHHVVATQFGVHINTIQALWRRFQQFGIHINTIQALWRRFQKFGIHINTIPALWRRFQQFGVHINTIQALWRRFQQFGARPVLLRCQCGTYSVYRQVQVSLSSDGHSRLYRGV